MVDEVLNILAMTGYEVYRQGSLAGNEEYPDSFFTFWEVGSPDHAHYDNRRYGTEWAYEVNFYSTDPDLTYSVLEEVIVAFESAGWTVPSRGNDVRSDEPTHTGRGVNIYFLEV